MPFRLCSPCARGYAPRGNFFGSSAAWDFLLFFFPPFRGSQGAPGVVSQEASSRGRARGVGGGVSGHSSVARERTSVSSAPSGAGKGEVARSQRTPTPLPRLLLPAHHSTLGDVMSREKFQRTAPLLDPPVLPDPRIEEQGRIVELALGRTALVTVAVVLALAPLTVRGRERRRQSSSRSLSSSERSRYSDRSRSRRVRSRSRGDQSRSSD